MCRVGAARCVSSWSQSLPWTISSRAWSWCLTELCLYTSLHIPEVVSFSRYCRYGYCLLRTIEDTLEIMAMDCPSHQPLPFFRTFVRHIWNVFQSVCLDLSELRSLVSVTGCAGCAGCADGVFVCVVLQSVPTLRSACRERRRLD